MGCEGEGVLAKERKKYQRMWETGEYGGSPGLQAAPIAWEWFEDLGCSSLTDWGCGDGQAMQWFLENSAAEVTAHDSPEPEYLPTVDVYGVDLVWVAPPELNVVEAPLANPAGLPVTDFAFSADVLEHLPPDEVAPSLESITEHTRIGGFFQIATRPDSCGELIGETLHLTVEPAEWWERQVSEYFDVERVHKRRDTWVRLWLRK